MNTHSWWMVIAISFGVGVASGLFFGLLGDWLGLSPSLRTVGVGVSVGIAAAVLTARRRAAINTQRDG